MVWRDTSFFSHLSIETVHSVMMTIDISHLQAIFYLKIISGSVVPSHWFVCAVAASGPPCPYRWVCFIFPDDLGDGKDKHGNTVVFLILKTAVEKNLHFSPQAVQQILGLVSHPHSLPRCLTKEGSSPERGVGLQQHCLRPDFKSIPLNNAHCSSIKILSPKVLTEFINRPYISAEGLRWFITVKLM